MIKFINIWILLLFCTYSYGQYYDVGHNTHYFNIANLDSSKYRIIKTVFDADPLKETKRIFNYDGELMEELVYLNSTLISGIEYFIHPNFPFLQVPRIFKVEEVIHKSLDYENTNISSSLVKYDVRDTAPKIMTVRVYNNNIQDFYILNGDKGYSIYFK